MSTQKKLLTKTMHIGLSTLASRVFGIIRELLMIRYLGATGLSDTFLTAYKIPNSLRKIFAEGALSAAFIPTAAQAAKQNDTQRLAALTSLGLILFEGIVLIVCALVMLYAKHVLYFIAPGFSPEQIEYAIPMVHILMPMILFISSSALLGSTLQTVDHFTISALGPIILNSVFIFGIIICLWYSLPVTALCWFILAGSVIHFLAHLKTYLCHNFFFCIPQKKDFVQFGSILWTFLLCLPSTSLMEIALFIDTSFASLLPAGSISLLFYANRFVGIPLGVFATAFSTILLPHLSKLVTYSPKRLHFYLLETTKFVFWITIPISLLMSFFSYDIFATIFLSKKFTLMQAEQASVLLKTFLVGLFSFSLNKILLSIFYSLRAAWIPALVSLSTTIMNIVFNILFIEKFQAMGLAMATVCSTALQSIIYIIILHKKFGFRLYPFEFLNFVVRCSAQLALFSGLFAGCYWAIAHSITTFLPAMFANFLLAKIGLWLWVGALSLLFFSALWYTRKRFGINSYFLG